MAGGIINGGFIVFERPFLERFLKNSDEVILEREPLQQLAREGELMVYDHQGFWQPMDPYREYKLINTLWASGQAPWKMWS